jgi:2-haloacid dehalogenase
MQTLRWNPDVLDAVVFDVVGTLVDEDRTWRHSAQRIAEACGISDADGLREAWQDGLDRRVTAVIAGEQAWRPHRDLMREAASEAIAGAGGSAGEAPLAWASAVDDEYPAWPDAAKGLALLRRRRLVAGVSNADLSALVRLAHRNALPWDIAISTGSVNTFKPDWAAYRYAIQALRLDPARTLFVAAHPWDLRAAAQHGFRTAYVARPAADRPAPDDRFDLQVDDIVALAAALG